MGGISRRRRKDRRSGERADATDLSFGPGSADDGGDGDGLGAVAANTGAATAASGGIANTGVWIDRSVRQEAPRQPARWPHLVGNLPGRALGFQERAESSRLRMVLETEGTAVVGQVLSGLGGVGKTQLAADYARTAFVSGRLDVLVWVTAASRQAVIDGYARAAVELLGVEPDEHSAQRFLAWLQPSAARAVCRWLVVLDDLADPADLTGLWPPASASGRTVVTTRRRDASLTGPGRRRVDVGVFTPAEATAALHQVLAERDHPAQPPEQIEALAAELGFLPLALSQAAAYITDADLECAAYRIRLADRTRSLASLLPRPAQGQAAGDTLPDEQAATVAATWSLSVDRADGLHPRGLARPMLQLTTVLDPNGIPQAVLTGTVARHYLASHRTPDADMAAPPGEDDAEAALRVLHRLSLVDHDRASRYREVRVHQLVQRATREDEALGGGLGAYAALADAAADALLAIWPSAERDELGQVLRSNATALYETGGTALLHSDHVRSLLFRAAASLGDTGQISGAIDAFVGLSTAITQCLGPAHPDALVARYNLAHCRSEAGDVARASAEFRELLGDALPVLGPFHRLTVAALRELERLGGRAGDAAGAQAGFSQLLTDLPHLRGPEHPETLSARNEQAFWRGEAGDPLGAVAAFRELLSDTLRVLGPDHSGTLTVRGNLAYWRGEAGDPVGAAASLEELLADEERVLGPDNPQTLTTRHNLALARGQAGDTAGAVAAFRELLSDTLRVLGPDHLSTLKTRAVLAASLGEAGDLVGSVAAHEEVAEDFLRLVGPDHPDTLTARHNLAQMRGLAGDTAGATAATEELLLDFQRVFGRDNPRTLAVGRNLEQWRKQAGRG